MANFKRGDKGGFGGKKKFGNDRGFNKGERTERPSMHRAICSECGRPCEVPFRPSGDKPVFCSDCFGRRESAGDSRPERRASGRPERREQNEFSFEEKRMFRAICDKCGRECEVPFRPNGEKPVFCSDCFVRGEKGGGGNASAGPDQNKKQFETINSKLDYILKLLSNRSTDEKPSKAMAVSKIEAKGKAAEMAFEAESVPAPKEISKKSVDVKKETKKKKEAEPKKEIKPKKAAKKAVVKKK